jgi:hypothetical protein
VCVDGGTLLGLKGTKDITGDEVVDVPDAVRA